MEEELHFALAIRVEDVDELWYLVADSFNFRSSLGSDAGYATEMNLRMLATRLALLAPNASRDEFVTAILNGKPMPPPLPSLVAFFRTVAKMKE